MSGTILLVEDDKIQSGIISKILDNYGYSVTVCSNGKEALQFLNHDKNEQFDVILLDLYMPEISGFEALEVFKEQYPELEVIILSGSVSSENLHKAMSLGAIEYINKPVDPERFNITVSNIIKISTLKRVLNRVIRNDDNTVKFHDIVGNETSLASDINFARKASLSNVPVLITGEIGVGKETMARAIHGEGNRVGAPFMMFDCRLCAPNMVTAELFGYCKNALPGLNDDYAGKCFEAEHGTLFLRNVEALPMEAQSRLLSLIQNKEYVPVGAEKPIKTDVRIISSTSSHLNSFVKRGLFREDLYFRLSIEKFHIMPIRERRDDILPIAYRFIKEFAMKESLNLKDIRDDAKELLTSMYWALNIIEIRHLIHYCMVIGNHDMIDAKMVEEAKEYFSRNPIKEDIQYDSCYTIAMLDEKNNIKTLEDIEHEAIMIALRHHEHNVMRTSKALGIAKSTLYKKIHEKNITIEGYP